MKVLKPITDSQSFYFIPRDYNITSSVNFRDDQTNEVVAYTPTIEKVNDYIKITGVFNLIEGRFYDVTIDNKTIEKVFCTNQPINQNSNEQYSVNKNVYTTDNSYSNDYIII
jgi:hypothetical protein